MESNKKLKLLIVGVFVLVSLASGTYFTRTVIDIGCAKTVASKGSLKRSFLTMNCWHWERSFELQGNLN